MNKKEEEQMQNSVIARMVCIKCNFEDKEISVETAIYSLRTVYRAFNSFTYDLDNRAFCLYQSYLAYFKAQIE